MDIYQTLVDAALNGNGGGGGGSSFTLIASDEFEYATTATTEQTVKTLNTETTFRTADKLTAVRVYDKAGAKNGYFAEFWGIIFDYEALNGSPSAVTFGNRLCIYKTSGGAFSTSTSAQGVYPYQLSRTSNTDRVQIRAKATSSMAIDGTYVVEVYLLDFPDGISPVNR